MSAMEQASPRPRQVTVAGWLIILASVGLVVTVWQQIATIHSITTREAMEAVISEPPFDAFRLEVDEVLDWVRVMSMISGACATATAILGWQALQRSKGARVALSVLAVPLFLAGVGSGAVLSTAIAVAVAWLWLQPARDWFEGVWRPAPPEEERRAAPPVQDRTQQPAQQPTQQPAQQPAAGPSGSGGDSGPPPYHGWASVPASHLPPPTSPPAAPHLAPPVTQPFPVPAAGAPMARPRAVIGAAVLTWVFSVAVVSLFLYGVVQLLDDPQRIIDELERQDPQLVEQSGVTVGMVRAMVVAMAAVVALWGLAACVLAVFVVRRRRWARILLLISAGGAGILMILGALAGTYLALPAFACAGTFGLLLRRDVVAWFRAPDISRSDTPGTRQ